MIEVMGGIEPPDHDPGSAELREKCGDCHKDLVAEYGGELLDAADNNGVDSFLRRQ